MGREVQEGRHLRLTHVDVWQKTTKFCKAIILQLKNKFLKNKKINNFPPKKKMLILIQIKQKLPWRVKLKINILPFTRQRLSQLLQTEFWALMIIEDLWIGQFIKIKYMWCHCVYVYVYVQKKRNKYGKMLIVIGSRWKT